MDHYLYKPHLERELYASVVTISPAQLKQLCKFLHHLFPFLRTFFLMFRHIFICNLKKRTNADFCYMHTHHIALVARISTAFSQTDS